MIRHAVYPFLIEAVTNTTIFSGQFTDSGKQDIVYIGCHNLCALPFYPNVVPTQKLPYKNSTAVREGMIALLSALPPSMVRSVTPDRGKKFASNKQIIEAIDGFSVLLPCSTRSPATQYKRKYQQLNSSVLPFQHCSDDFFSTCTLRLNLRPRKCFGW